MRKTHPVGAALAATLLTPAASWGIVNIGTDLELEGYVRAQNIWRVPSPSDAEMIMQRNTAQLEGKYYFLRDGQAFGRFDTGPVAEATFTFIGRGIYDSVYDFRDKYDDLSGGNFESAMREAFVDILIPPFTLRLGKQQVVWGEADNFRALDVINPLDLTWHWSRESWEDIRIPLWMARGIYDIGKIGPFEESFVEVIWIPWDFKPNRVETDPRYPWSLYGGLPEVANSVILGGELHDLQTTIRDRRPDRDLSNGQAGIRYKGIWNDIDFSFNYFYGYSGTTGARFRQDLSGIEDDTFHATVDLVNPRTHMIGMTANYSEEKYTQSVIRLESAITKGVPVAIEPGAPLGVDGDQDQFDTVHQSVVMVGIDRPTWIRSLNSLRTFFLSGQLFWRRYLDYSSHFRGLSAVVPARIDGEVVPGRFVSVNEDRLDQDEFVMSFSASTTYGAAGLWKPDLVVVFDPRSTGGYSKFGLEYLFSKHLVFTAEQYFYWQVEDEEIGPWQVGDIWSRPGDRRHETILEIQFQF